MDADKDTFDAAKLKTEAVSASAYAPRPVLLALLSLMDPAEAHAWAAQKHESEGNARWEVVWASETALAVCSARKAVADWDLDSPESQQRADALKAWVVPLSSVSRIGIAGLDEKMPFDAAASWQFTAIVTLQSGETLSLPAIPEGRLVGQDRDRTEQLIMHLRNALKA